MAELNENMIQGTKTITGDTVSFNTPRNVNIKSLKVNFLPQQAGSGNASPDNVREIFGWNDIEVYHKRKNIAHIYGYSASTIRYITYTRNLSNPYGTSINTINFKLPDTKLLITQSQSPNSTLSGYQNGYVVVGVKGLQYDKLYNVSFKVTDIISNPLNATLNSINILSNGRSLKEATKVIGNRVVFENVIFRPNLTYTEMTALEIRLCGMSFTLSEFMVTPVSDTNYDWVPYYDTNLFDVNSPISYGAYNTSTRVYENNNARITTDYIPVKYGNTYTESIDPNGTENLLFVNYSLFDKNYNILGLRAENGDVNHNGCSTHRITINIEEAAYIKITVRHAEDGTDLSSTTLDNAQLRFEDGSYVTNNEWTVISLPTNRKNILDIRNCVFASGYINGANSSGVIGGLSATYTYTHNYISCHHLAGKTITINHGPGGTNPGIAFYDENYNGISAVKNNGVAAGNPMTVEVPQDAYYFRFSTRPTYLNDLQIEIGSEATEYEPFDNTMYGGYVDLITGEVVKTYDIFTAKLSEANRKSVYDNCIYYTFYVTKDSGFAIRNNTQICNIAPYQWELQNGIVPHFYLYSSNALVPYNVAAMVFMPLDVDESTQIQIVYPLETPVTYTLSPMELKTFINTNNIWSNASSVEVEYEFINEFNAIESRKIIMGNTPHLETVSGMIAEFGTDIAAPLKDCKIYFNPVQDLNGFDKPFLAGNNKNLLEISSSKLIASTGSPTITQNLVITGNAVAGFIVSCSPSTTYTYSLRSLIYGPNLKQRVYEYEELPTTMEYSYMTVEQEINNTDTTLPYSYRSLTFTTKSTTNYLIVGYINNTGKSVTLYEMMLERGSTRTEYEPYTSADNICPIYPRNFVNIRRAGESVLDLTTSNYLSEARSNSGLGWIKVRNSEGKVVGIRVNGTTSGTNCFQNLNYMPDGKLSMAGGEYYAAGENSMFNDRVYGKNTAADSFTAMFGSPTQTNRFVIPQGQYTNYVRTQLITQTGVKYSNRIYYPRMYFADTLSSNTIIFTEAHGENVFDYTSYPLTKKRWIGGHSGIDSTSDYYNAVMGYVPCEEYRGMTLTLNLNPGGANPGLAFYDSNKTYISGIKNNGVPRGNPMSGIVPSNASYYRFTVPDDCRPEDIQIEVGEPINAYAGYVDLLNGELVVTAKMYTFDGNNDLWRYAGLTNGKHRFYTRTGSINPIPDIAWGTGGNDLIACNWLRPEANGASGNKDQPPNLVTVGTYNPQLYVGVDFCTTLEEWNTYLTAHPLQVVCNLATPLHYKVAAYTPSTIRGVNNMWSDEYSNTTVEATYWKHTDDSIQRLAGTAYTSEDSYAFATSDGFIIGEEADYIEY